MRKTSYHRCRVRTCGRAGAIGRERRYRTWGVDPADATRALPGDDVVPEPTGRDHTEHRRRCPPRRDLAVARPDGLRARRLVQLDAMDMKGKSATRSGPNGRA